MAKRKDVSLLVSAAGWIAHLVDKLISTLREQGVSDENIHALVTERGEELIGVIADAVVEFLKRTVKVHDVLVDFEASVEELVRLGDYDWANSNITSPHFPTSRTGKVETKIKLFHFDQSISSEQAIREMDKAGYRPAEAHELLAFGVKYPDVQREFPVVALGSVWRRPYGFRLVVCLYGIGVKRYAGLHWFGRGWGDDWRFAAVRN